MIEWLNDNPESLKIAYGVGALLSAVFGGFIFGLRGIFQGKKNANESPLPNQAAHKENESLQREFASLQRDLDRIENRQSNANGRMLDILTRIDETVRACLNILREK